MSVRTTALLLGLVLVTAAFLWRDANSRQLLVALVTGDELRPPPEAIVPLAAVEPEDVVALELRIGEREFSMERADGSWKGPFPPAAVDEFLASLRSIGRVSHIPIGDRDLEEFGLAQPQRSIVFVLRAPGEPVRVDIGRTNPAITAVYTRINRVGPIVLAGAVLIWEIDKLAGVSRDGTTANPARR